MATRILPIRNTRKKDSNFRQSPSPQKIIKNEPLNEKEIQRKQNESKRKMNELINLQKYPYRRALHYYFNLDQFPRSKNTVSYAQDDKNIFNFSYSKDKMLIKNQKIGDLISRKLIGLPINCTGEHLIRKQNRCKNICYSYLAQNQDKKHNNERIIYTIKLIIKKIQKITIIQLEKYDFIKKDSDLLLILDEKVNFIQKKHILQDKLNSLLVRKEVNKQNWLFDDTVLYYHSLNQSLHNKVLQLKYKLTEEYIQSLVVKKSFQQCNAELTLLDFVKKNTQYYNMNQPALSFTTIRKIVSRKKTQILIKGRQNDSQVNYPIIILYFGHDQIFHDLSQFLLGRKAFSLGEVHFYEIKTIIKKIFKRDLQVRSEKIISYEQFYKIFRKKYQEICYYKQSIQIQRQKDKCPTLDHKFNEDVAKGLKGNIFKLCQNKVEINKRQFMFLMIYYWLTRSMEDIYPYLIRIKDLIEIIGSDFFSKVCNQLVEGIGTPLVGLIFYIFQAFNDLMSKNKKQVSNLFIEFDKDLNVCMVWNQQKQKASNENEGIVLSRKKFRYQ